MVTEKELLQAIADCEAGADSFQTCQKLATLYTVRDHMYPSDTTLSRDTKADVPAIVNGGSDFMKAIHGKSPSEVWAIIDELMSTLYVVNTRLYDAVLRRIHKL